MYLYVVPPGPAGGSSRPQSVTRPLCRGTDRRVDRRGRPSSSLCRRGPVSPGPTLLLLLFLFFLLSSRSLVSAPTHHRPEPVPVLWSPPGGALLPSLLSDTESRFSRPRSPHHLLLQSWSSFLTSALMKSSTWIHWSLLTPPHHAHTQVRDTHNNLNSLRGAVHFTDNTLVKT